MVINKFNELYKKSPQEATDFYYNFSCDTDYIRRYRIVKDMKWTADTEYGRLDVTINLSKPEKDPKAIAAARNAKQSAYPKCQLCVENEGYAGRIDHPARETHRIIPITIDGGKWGFQYSPYVYYNEHCIVLNSEHTPMKIDESAFRKLFDFIKLFPHYFIGSNADLPIVGVIVLCGSPSVSANINASLSIYRPASLSATAHLTCLHPVCAAPRGQRFPVW